MKRLTAFYSAILCSIITFANNIEYNLAPTDCTIKDEIYTTVDTIALTFDCEVSCSWLEFIHAYIYCDGIEVASGMGIPDFEKPTQYADNIALIKIGGNNFIGLLPKGKSYQLHILPEVICNNDNGILRYNDNIYIDFTIPDNLGYGRTTFSEDTISKAIYDKFKFKFPTDIKATGIDNYLILNQEGKEPVKIAFKVYEHYLYADLDEAMYFDDGVKYTLTLPAGSVSAKYRDDIVNLETNIDFVGGYKSESKLIPMSCSLNDTVCEPINTVTFTFDQEVSCTQAEFIHAYIYCEGKEVASGNASYSFFGDENRDKTKAVLDIFPNPFVPEKGKSYRLHILPEVIGSIDEESSKWNEDIYVDFVGGDISGVENTEAETVSVTCVNGQLTVSGIAAGTEVAAYSVDGKAVANMIAGSTTVGIPLPAKGIYLITVKGKSFKVTN